MDFLKKCLQNCTILQNFIDFVNFGVHFPGKSIENHRKYQKNIFLTLIQTIQLFQKIYFPSVAGIPIAIRLATSHKKNRKKIQIKISGSSPPDQKLHRYHGETSTNPWIRMENHEMLPSLPGHNFALARRIFMCLPKFFVRFARSATQASFYPGFIFWTATIFSDEVVRNREKSTLRSCPTLPLQKYKSCMQQSQDLRVG